MTDHQDIKGRVQTDGLWSWLVVAGNVIIGITTLGFFRSLPVYFWSLRLEYDLEYVRVTSLPGLFTLGMAIGCFALPALTRKFGSRKICLAGGMVLGLSNITSSQVNSFLVMQICTGFLSGFATGILTYTMYSSSSRYFVKHRAKATGISTIGIPVGAIILPPVTDRLIDYCGWRGALLIISGILLNSCVSASLYRPVILPESSLRKKSREVVEESSPDGELEKDESHLDKADPTAKEKLLQNQSFGRSAMKKMNAALDLRLFKSLSFDIVLLSSIFYFSGYVGVNTFLIPFAREYIGLESFQSSTMISIVGFAECIAKVVTGFIADSKKVNKYLLIASMSIISSICVIGMTFTKSFVSLAIISLLYGLFVTAYVGIIIVIVCEIVGPNNIRTAVGYQGFFYNSFLSLTIFMMGRLLDKTGDARSPFYLGSILLFMAATCVLIVYVRVKKKSKKENV